MMGEDEVEASIPTVAAMEIGEKGVAWRRRMQTLGTEEGKNQDGATKKMDAPFCSNTM